MMNVEEVVSSSDSGLELTPPCSSGQPSPEELSTAQPLAQTSDGSCYRNAQYLPPCRVCGNNASGFHYGVNSCEACKAFFRRSIARKVPYNKCQSGGNCAIKLSGRNICSDCRFKKCIEVGMSKTAIKTGRYTIEKRTQDTNEVKGLHNVPDIPKLRDNHEYDHIVIDIVQAYDECFPDTAYCYRHPENIELRLQNLLIEHNVHEVDKILYSPGHKKSSTFDEAVKQNIGLFEYIKSMGSSIIGDDNALLTNPLYLNSSKEALEILLIRIDGVVRSIVQFAKRVPGFTSLSMADQIILIKTAKAELFCLLKYQSFDFDRRCVKNYRVESGDFWLTPFSLHLQLLCFNEDHRVMFTRFLHRIQSHNYTIETGAVIAAFCVMSPDREELSAPDKVDELRNKLLKILEYTLQKSHPEDPSMLAKTLLLLPTLRTSTDYHNKAVKIAHERYHPNVTPLLKELME